ncbi:MAG TPA: IS110 family transposase [Candidatus Mediterraneibacter vanvlietii]|nr:IS110 family transposase [Candidatus Mediterraneibacter vanvlietii]
MNYNTVYVGMDVHKETFTLRYFTFDMTQPSAPVEVNADYKQILKYLDSVRRILGKDCQFLCGYEAGSLGYTLYRQLREHHVDCVILAPTTIPETRGKKKLKNDKRDSGNIAKALAYRTYSPVHIPSPQDEEVKEYIRMRSDHKIALKKVKQQILSFCLRHGYRYTATRHYWTQEHMKWLRSLPAEGVYKDILEEYMGTFTYLSDKIKRLDQKIEEFAQKEEYQEPVKKLCCFIGIKTLTALTTIVEVGDFKRFPAAWNFSSYLGLMPGEDSSGSKEKRLGITKAGNAQVRKLLIEAAQSYSRGSVGNKSRALKQRQEGNPPGVINYADRANERLRRKYYHMVLGNGKKANVAKTAVARELSCFIWGMMTENMA